MIDATKVAAELAIQTFWGKWRLVIIGVSIIAILLAIGLLWWLIFIRPASALHDAKLAQASGALAQGGQQSGRQAIEIIVKRQDGDAQIDNQTRSNNVTIMRAAGASDPVNLAVDAAGRRAICLRRASSDLPDCQRLLQPNP